MSDGLPYADIVILALIAGFILLRLRGVLGQKTGQDNPPAPYSEYKAQGEDSPIVQVAQQAGKARLLEEKTKDAQLLEEIKDAAVREGITAISAADKEFSLGKFMEGAHGAFEMTFDAFNKKDRDTLKMLLSPALFAVFAAELDKRAAGENYTETTLLSVVSQEVTAASLQRSVARVGIRFVSEQVSLVRDSGGAIVEGNPASSEHAEDEWTFERDLSSRNPNWKIIDT